MSLTTPGNSQLEEQRIDLDKVFGELYNYQKEVYEKVGLFVAAIQEVASGCDPSVKQNLTEILKFYQPISKTPCLTTNPYEGDPNKSAAQARFEALQQVADLANSAQFKTSMSAVTACVAAQSQLNELYINLPEEVKEKLHQVLIKKSKLNNVPGDYLAKPFQNPMRIVLLLGEIESQMIKQQRVLNGDLITTNAGNPIPAVSQNIFDASMGPFVKNIHKDKQGKYQATGTFVEAKKKIDTVVDNINTMKAGFDDLVKKLVDELEKWKKDNRFRFKSHKEVNKAIEGLKNIFGPNSASEKDQLRAFAEVDGAVKPLAQKKSLLDDKTKTMLMVILKNNDLLKELQKNAPIEPHTSTASVVQKMAAPVPPNPALTRPALLKESPPIPTRATPPTPPLAAAQPVKSAQGTAPPKAPRPIDAAPTPPAKTTTASTPGAAKTSSAMFSQASNNKEIEVLLSGLSTLMRGTKEINGIQKFAGPLIYIDKAIQIVLMKPSSDNQVQWKTIQSLMKKVMDEIVKNKLPVDSLTTAVNKIISAPDLNSSKKELKNALVEMRALLEIKRSIDTHGFTKR